MFTDIFIKRPVLAVCISLLITLLGLQSLKNKGYSEQEAKTEMYNFPGFTPMMVDALVVVYWPKI